ncbi:uncharacterized protein SCHCODRAFT_02516828 [Schizophyllum commune H4-8]|nr:uncharacterized protein SCHCODRAFT_02516828 [Schizophyllum commune H4-8]KAI5887182.1 hypothetical protein SCHCODRAFT_02516828 [Schizophyllum commune H4-8]
MRSIRLKDPVAIDFGRLGTSDGEQRTSYEKLKAAELTLVSLRLHTKALENERDAILVAKNQARKQVEEAEQATRTIQSQLRAIIEERLALRDALSDLRQELEAGHIISDSSTAIPTAPAPTHPAQFEILKLRDACKTKIQAGPLEQGPRSGEANLDDQGSSQARELDRWDQASDKEAGGANQEGPSAMHMQVATEQSVTGAAVDVGRDEGGKAQTPQSRSETTSAPDELEEYRSVDAQASNSSIGAAEDITMQGEGSSDESSVISTVDLRLYLLFQDAVPHPKFLR